MKLYKVLHAKKILMLSALTITTSLAFADYGQYQNGDLIFNLDLNSYQFADKSKTKFTIDGNMTGFLSEQDKKKYPKEFLDRMENQVQLYIDCKSKKVSLLNMKIVDRETGTVLSNQDAAILEPAVAKNSSDSYMIKDLCNQKK